MPTPILKQGNCLIVTVQSAPADADWRQLQDELLEQVGRLRIRSVVVDVTALEVMDSFATRMLRDMVDATRLRGAKTVLVGIQPEVAFAMVQLGLTARFEGVETALNLEEGLILLNRGKPGGRSRGR